MTQFTNPMPVIFSLLPWHVLVYHDVNFCNFKYAFNNFFTGFNCFEF
jgi:hypothetical protein